MPITCPARLFAFAARGAALAGPAALLAACTATGDGPPSSLFATVSLLLVAGLAGTLGGWLSHAWHRNQLRSTRESLRRARQLDGGWCWQTDAQHRLLSWSAEPQAAPSPCALFDAGSQPALLELLQLQLAFADLSLQATEVVHGSRGWRLKGIPRHSDDGSFAGFEGRASPTDAEARRRHVAAALPAALPAALAACSEVALLAVEGDEGWQVAELNPAAALAWPSASAGQPVAGLLAAWPDLIAALAASKPGAPVQELQGWRLVSVPAPAAAAGLPRAVVLKQLRPADAAVAAAPDAENETFSFTLSHDLRAPIRVVEGFTRIVKEDYGRQLDRVGNDHLDRVLGAAARMNLMIDALLTLARLSQQPLVRQRVNLSQLAGYVVDDLRRSAPERSADIDIEPQLSAWGDPTLLRLVLENLLGNAWKYTGRCTQTQISLQTATQGGRSAFVVRDNGAGFDMRSADRLFGLFQRLHSASDFPGHGVGLASVRRIVRRHGGDIWAESEPGRGAAFYFTLAA